MQEEESHGKPEEKKETEFYAEERKENIELINDFFLIVLGIVLGYFAAYAIASPTVVGVSVFVKALTREATHFPILPTLHQTDILFRALGFFLLLPTAVIFFPLMLTRYIRWLKTQTKIHLARELTELFFLLFWPIAGLWIFSPPMTLDVTSQAIQRLIGVLYVTVNIGYFLYKTRSVRRGFLY